MKIAPTTETASHKAGGTRRIHLLNRGRIVAKTDLSESHIENLQKIAIAHGRKTWQWAFRQYLGIYIRQACASSGTQPA
ncbi:MAG: hypothetical protein WCG52_11255 [bacterium]